MKTGILAIFLSVPLTCASMAWADDTHHPQQIKGKPAASTTATEKQFEQARQEMKKTLAQMDKIRQTKDTKERQRLMDEHMQSLRNTMQTMRGMGGPMMIDMMGSSEKPMMGGMNSNQRMNMMERRMDMMQMMMEQMMTREYLQTPAQ